MANEHNSHHYPDWGDPPQGWYPGALSPDRGWPPSDPVPPLFGSKYARRGAGQSQIYPDVWKDIEFEGDYIDFLEGFLVLYSYRKDIPTLKLMLVKTIKKFLENIVKNKKVTQSESE